MGKLLNLRAASESVAAPQRYRIEVLGSFALYREDIPVATHTWRSRPQTLLRLLAVAPGLRRPRDEVVDLLWPDSAPEAGAANLRDLVRLVRRSLGDDSSLVVLEQGWVRLNPAYQWDVDLVRFEELARDAGDDVARLEEAVSLMRGQPLPEDQYADWAVPIQERATRHWQQLCLHLTERLRAQGDVERALGWAERVLDHDPLHEAALQQALLLLESLGRRHEALQRYRQFADLVARELDVSVLPETQAIIERIMRHDPRAEETHGEAERVDSGQTAPQPDSPTAPLVNLPVQATSFIGRDKEIAALEGLLRRGDRRLLTLSGPGGIGKTRLALRVVEGLADAFPDGIYVVSLASLADPERVPSAIAATLGLKEAGGMPIARTVMLHLRLKLVLLVLDNFEHLRAAAPFVAELVAHCSRLCIVVTSRAVLQLSAEYEFAVPPLPTPDPAQLSGAEHAAQDAVRLFVDRAQAKRRDFALTDANVQVVGAICRRLDGLPLAIELAAARTRLFPPPALLPQLDHRLKLLTGGARDLPARQQTLRGTIDWSYSLLDEAERTLFARLSIFAGGCELEAAQEVCSSDDVDVLASLVEQSLLRSEGEAQSRFSMLETIREYALEQLEARGEARDIAERHAAYYLRWAQAAYQGCMGPEQVAWLDRQEQEHDNLRAALTWFYQTGDLERAFTMAVALQCLWLDRCHHAEAAAWYRMLLAADGPVAKRTRARMLLSARWFTGRPEHLEESLRLYRELGDATMCSSVLCGLADLALHQGASARAAVCAREALALARQTGDQWETGESLQLLGIALLHEGDLAQARTALQESLSIFRGAGNPGMVAWAARWAAVVTFLHGDSASAIALGGEALSIEQSLDNAFGIAAVTWILGLAWLERGDVGRAEAQLHDGLAMVREDVPDGLLHIGALAIIAARQGQPRRSARLFGAFDAARERADRLSLPPQQIAYFDRYGALVREQLGEPEWAAAWADGRAMKLADAIAYARQAAGHTQEGNSEGQPPEGNADRSHDIH